MRLTIFIQSECLRVNRDIKSLLIFLINLFLTSPEHPHWSALRDFLCLGFSSISWDILSSQCFFCLQYLHCPCQRWLLGNWATELFDLQDPSLFGMLSHFYSNPLSKCSDRCFSSGKGTLSHSNFYFWISLPVSGLTPLTVGDERAAFTPAPSLTPECCQKAFF